MVREGATTMPDSYFRDRLVTGSQPPPEERNTPNGKLSRAAGFFRASRSLEVDNPKIT